MSEYLLASVFVVLARLFFQLRRLNIKKLQEQGLSPLAALYYQKYAIYPAGMLLLITFKTEYLSLLWQPEILQAFSLLLLFWLTSEFIGFWLLKSSKSLSFLNAFSSLLAIPTALGVGYFLNGDIPNSLAYIALIILSIAVIVKPTVQQQENKGNMFAQTGGLILFLVLLMTVFDVVDNGLYRFVLQNFEATLFGVAVYTFLTVSSINLLFCFKKITPTDKKIASKYKWLAFSIAPFWFLASIPEGYGFANVPIYTYLGISTVSFLVDIGSDLNNNRIHLNWQTGIFTSLVVVSIVLSILSLR